ncbi:dentin sialophosphoprotein-like [Halichondria panicea]|uniref:dentin sialophosphoprotein-like n=1 Tax=Halichondria panicea TaxID=6063 RepID=UPI00312B80BE
MKATIAALTLLAVILLIEGKPLSIKEKGRGVQRRLEKFKEKLISKQCEQVCPPMPGNSTSNLECARCIATGSSQLSDFLSAVALARSNKNCSSRVKVFLREKRHRRKKDESSDSSQSDSSDSSQSDSSDSSQSDSEGSGDISPLAEEIESSKSRKRSKSSKSDSSKSKRSVSEESEDGNDDETLTMMKSKGGKSKSNSDTDEDESGNGRKSDSEESRFLSPLVEKSNKSSMRDKSKSKQSVTNFGESEQSKDDNNESADESSNSSESEESVSEEFDSESEASESDSTSDASTAVEKRQAEEEDDDNLVKIFAALIGDCYDKCGNLSRGCGKPVLPCLKCIIKESDMDETM